MAHPCFRSRREVKRQKNIFERQWKENDHRLDSPPYSTTTTERPCEGSLMTSQSIYQSTCRYSRWIDNDRGAFQAISCIHCMKCSEAKYTPHNTAWTSEICKTGEQGAKKNVAAMTLKKQTNPNKSWHLFFFPLKWNKVTWGSHNTDGEPLWARLKIKFTDDVTILSQDSMCVLFFSTPPPRSELDYPFQKDSVRTGNDRANEFRTNTPCPK